MRKVGLTGTHRHVTPAARTALLRWMEENTPAELHHGDCVEADETAHALAASLNWRIVIHPGPSTALRAFCRGAEVVWPVRPNLVRNVDIVMETAELVAIPFGFEEELRSGTWATVRRARKEGRPVTIIWPDGSLEP